MRTGTRGCAETDPERWRARLEEMWRRKVDLIVGLSLAYHDQAGLPGDADGPGLIAGAPGARLRRRLMAEHRQLAEIEQALGRLRSGGFGICERCAQPIPAGWLAENPQSRSCPGAGCAELAAVG